MEELTEVLKHALKHGHLSEAVTALGILTRYVDGLVEEERWQRTVREKLYGQFSAPIVD